MTTETINWIAGPFGHMYAEDERGDLMACPQNADGTPDDTEGWAGSTMYVSDWAEGKEEALAFWKAQS